MNNWQSTYLGRGALPRELSDFEIEALFTYSASERRVIVDVRRSPALKLALALQIGFLRMTGCLLDALRFVPPVILRKAAVLKKPPAIQRTLTSNNSDIY